MIYVLIPHSASVMEDHRLFTSYAIVEHVAINIARSIEKEGHNPDWCIVIGYEGTDELYPTFLYTLVGSSHLRREKYPTPSP